MYNVLQLLFLPNTKQQRTPQIFKVRHILAHALTELPFPVETLPNFEHFCAFLTVICSVHMLYRNNNKTFFTATGLLSPLKIISCTFQL